MPATTRFRHSLGGRMLLFGVFPTAAILLGIIVWLANSMVRELRVENEQKMQLLAERVATEIDRGNTRAVVVAQVMAFAQSNGMFGDRAASVEYARQVLANLPELTGAYFGYEPDSRDVMLRLLVREGWKVRSAENGAEGLERVAESTPNLILLDLMMPVMDGFEFLAELRSHAKWQQLPVIVVSAKDLTPEERSYLESATQRVVTKGSDSGQSLLAALGKAIG